MYAVEVSDLTHYYGDRLIYENLSFKVESGKVFGILGKNGVGKSTLINIIMGYLRPYSGVCKVLGRPSFELNDELKKDIALLFEGFVSYDFLTISEYESFLASFYPKWDSQIYTELVALLKLNKNQKLNSLSFGQKSQVILASLFAQNAKILIFDDYSMGLDAGYRRLFSDFLKDYVKDFKPTIIITSHIMSDLERIIDEFLIIKRGGERLLSKFDDFMRDFNVYKLPKDFDLSSTNLRVDEFRSHKMAYGFENLPGFEKENANFEDKFLGFVGRFE